MGAFPPLTPHLVSEIRQGPLQPGDYVALGRFEDILRGRGSLANAEAQTAQNSAPLPRDAGALELCVVVIHGPSDRPVGARRRFVVEHDGDKTSVRPQHTRTEQLTSRRDDPTVEQWLAECLTPQDRLAGQ